MQQRVTLQALASGVVQGVNFRAFVLNHALRLGLHGFVRNLPGGESIEVIAQGGRASLEQLVRLLWKGPPGARVHQVQVKWGPGREGFEGFRIER